MLAISWFVISLFQLVCSSQLTWFVESQERSFDDSQELLIVMIVICASTRIVFAMNFDSVASSHTVLL